LPSASFTAFTGARKYLIIVTLEHQAPYGKLAAYRGSPAVASHARDKEGSGTNTL